MNPGTVAGFGSSRPRYIYVAEVLYDVTLSASGAFDTNDQWPAGLPSGYDRFEIEAQIRSTASTTADVAYLFFNSDTTNSNYANEQIRATDGGIVGTRVDNAQVFEACGASSQSDDFAFGTVYIPEPGGAKNKRALSYYGNRRDATGHRLGGSALYWESTAAITRIQLRTDNHPTDLFAAGSSMKLIGYRQMPLSELLA